MEETPGAAAVPAPRERSGPLAWLMREWPTFAYGVGAVAWWIGNVSELGLGASFAAAAACVAAARWALRRWWRDGRVSPWITAGGLGSLFASFVGFRVSLRMDDPLAAFTLPLLGAGLWLAVLLGVHTAVRVSRWPR